MAGGTGDRGSGVRDRGRTAKTQEIKKPPRRQDAKILLSGPAGSRSPGMRAPDGSSLWPWVRLVVREAGGLGGGCLCRGRRLSVCARLLTALSYDLPQRGIAWFPRGPEPVFPGL